MKHQTSFLIGAGAFLLGAVQPGTGLAFDQEKVTAAANPLGASALESNPSQAITNSITDSALQWLRNGIGNNGPEWAKRIEFDLDLQEDSEPVWSILTVQPLYQTLNREKTMFTQARLARNYKFGDERTTTNIGLGYRQLFLNNTLLLGANGFFDYESEMDHTRVGYGVEARWYNFDFYANYYDATSDKRTYTGSEGTWTEQALDGYDLELTSQIPYLPWMRLRGQYFEYDTVNASEDIDGWSASSEMDLHPNFRMELGVTDDNFSDNRVFAKFTFRLADSKKTAATTKLVDDKLFDMRDMSDYTLDKVRRNNTITVERVVSGAITISRQ